jgi:hypothetical protein
MPDRRRCKSEQAAAYYTRMGAALEHARLARVSSDSNESISVPLLSAFAGVQQPFLALLAEIDALGRRVAASSVAVKDAASAAAAFDGEPAPCAGPLYPLLDPSSSSTPSLSEPSVAAWMPSANAAASVSVGSSSVGPMPANDGSVLPPSEPPSIPSSPGYLAYASLGPAALLADVEKAEAGLAQLGADHFSLGTKLGQLQQPGVEGATRVLAEGEGSEEAQAASGAGAPPSPAGECCSAQLALLRQNIDLQLSVLRFVRSSASAAAAAIAAATAPGADATGSSTSSTAWPATKTKDARGDLAPLLAPPGVEDGSTRPA